MGTSSSSTANTDAYNRALRALGQTSVSINSHEVWHDIFALEHSQLDVFSMTSTYFIRALRRYRPGNLALLLYKCVEQLQVFLGNPKDQNFSSAKNAIMLLTRIVPYCLEKKDVLDDGTIVNDRNSQEDVSAYSADFGYHVLWENCMCNNENDSKSSRFDPSTLSMKERLTRFYARYCPSKQEEDIDMVLEKFTDSDVLMRHLEEKYGPESAVYAEEKEENEKKNKTASSSSASTEAGEERFPIQVPLGHLLIQSLVAVCFVPGFTIGLRQVEPAEPCADHPSVEPHLLWRGGIASHTAKHIGWTSEMTLNRIYVTRALIAVLTSQVFESSAQVEDPLRSFLLNTSACPHSSTLICSLMNQISSYQSHGLLPYTSHVIGGEEKLTFHCVQLLCILFDSYPFHYQASLQAAEEQKEQHSTEPAERSGKSDEHSEDDDEEEEKDVKKEVSPPKKPPVAQHVDPTAPVKKDAKTSPPRPPPSAAPKNAALKKIPAWMEDHAAWGFLESCSAESMSLILIGFGRLLGTNAYSKSTRLPHSQRSFAHIEELFLLLWKWIDRSVNFVRYFCKSKDAQHYIIPLLDMIMSGKEDASQASAMQIGIFILRKLSPIRQFVINCSDPVYQYIPFELPLFYGHYVDAIILSMHALLSSKHPETQSVHDSCATIISNMSAFTRTLSSTTSEKICSMLKIYSRASYLRQNAVHCFILAAVIEMIANMLQYQAAGNAHLIYGLLFCEESLRTLHAGLSDGSIVIPPNLLSKVHLRTIIAAIETTRPLVTEGASGNPNVEVLEIIKKTTLVGALPQPHTVMIRRFYSAPQTDTWAEAWMWGIIHMHNWPPLLDARSVELFAMRAIGESQLSGSISSSSGGSPKKRNEDKNAAPQKSVDEEEMTTKEKKQKSATDGSKEKTTLPGKPKAANTQL